jgi:glycoside/pentoside/hexuronide:cation symporter, GPH family
MDRGTRSKICDVEDGSAALLRGGMTARDGAAHGAPAVRDRISLPQLAAYGAGGIIPIALFNIAGILVGLMGNISMGLSAFWLGVILIIPRAWDAVADPLIGHLSDNTRTRWGRRRPYLLAGGILVAVFFVVMWWIPKGDTVQGWFPTEASYQWFQLGYILVSLTLFFSAVTIFEIPHGALGMEMTSDPHQRTRLFSAKSFVGNLFAMSTPWLLVLANMEVFKGPRGNEADGMRYVSMLVAAVLVPLSFWWFFTLREPGFARAAKQEATPFWRDMKRTVRNVNFIVLTLTIFTLAMGFNFVQLLGAYIPIYYVFAGDKAAGALLLGINGTVWAVTGLLAVFPLNWLSPRLGKRNTLVLAILLIALGQLAKIVCYDTAHPYLAAIPTIPISCGMLFFFTLGSSMVGDICDEDELETGHRSEGAFYSVFWWFIKCGTALASLISGALIVFTLFDENQVTKVDKLQGGIRDIHVLVEAWDSHAPTRQGGPGPVTVAKQQLAEALQDATEYVAYLESESTRVEDEGVEGHARRTAIVRALFATKGVGAELGLAKGRVAALNAQTAPSQVASVARDVAQLRVRAKLELARVQAAELHAYLTTKVPEPPESEAHYRALAHTSERIDAMLARMSRAPLAQLPGELVTIEAALPSLTQQTPYTLLMMRAIEIGLPLLACACALLFVLRYALTEQRSREINALLERRHAEQNASRAS